MSSRLLTDMHIEAEYMARKFLSAAYAANQDVLITCTYRDLSEQLALYEQGRSKPGKVVTWTKRGAHNFKLGDKPAALALDFVPLEMGKLVWDDEHSAWSRLIALGKAAGFKSGADWPKPDKPHLEHPHAKEIMGAVQQGDA